MINTFQLPHRPDSIYQHTFSSFFEKLYQTNIDRASKKSAIEIALHMAVCIYADASEKEQDRQYCKSLAVALMRHNIQIPCNDESAEAIAQQVPYWALLSTMELPPDLSYAHPNLSDVSTVRWDHFLLNVIRNSWMGIAQKNQEIMRHALQDIQSCRLAQAQWEPPYLKQLGCNAKVRAFTLCTLYHLLKGTELMVNHRLVPEQAFQADTCMDHLNRAKFTAVRCSTEILQATHAICTSAAELIYDAKEITLSGESHVI